MSAPDSSIGPAGSDLSEIAIRNLREQVQTLEANVLTLHARLEEARERRTFFEAAAAERLQVIQRGDSLLRARSETIQDLEQKLTEISGVAESLRSQLAAASDRKEESRSLAELAARERNLTRELLELKKEGLLHSIVRRVRKLLS